MSAFFICRGETPIPEHKDITDPNIHETKGAAAATSGQLLTATGAGTATFQTPTFFNGGVGWWDYNDVTTQTTPIALTTPGVKVDLTNDGAGVNTQSGFAIPSGTNIWDTGTNRLNFNNLSVGDTVELRMDITYTTTAANTAITVEFEFATGTGSAFPVIILPQLNIKSASTTQLVHSREFYIGSEVVRTNPGRIRAVADIAGSTVKVNGWYIRVIRL